MHGSGSRNQCAPEARVAGSNQSDLHDDAHFRSQEQADRCRVFEAGLREVSRGSQIDRYMREKRVSVTRELRDFDRNFYNGGH